MWLPLAHPLLGTWPSTQACVLTGNQTSDPLVCRLYGPLLTLRLCELPAQHSYSSAFQVKPQTNLCSEPFVEAGEVVSGKVMRAFEGNKKMMASVGR